MNPKQGSGEFEADLKAAFAEIRSAKGECPNAETIVRFVSAELDEEESQHIARHIRMCGVCDDLTERLRAFDAEAEVHHEVREPRRRVLAFLFHPAFSYSLVAVLGVSLFLVRRAPKAVPEHTSPPYQALPSVFAESAATFDLNTTRARENPIVVQLPPAGRSFTLLFGVPVRPGFRYSAQFIGPREAPVLPTLDVTNFDALGNTTLVCRREGFVAGRYTLRVKEFDPRGTATRRPLSFVFDVRD